MVSISHDWPNFVSEVWMFSSPVFKAGLITKWKIASRHRQGPQFYNQRCLYRSRSTIWYTLACFSGKSKEEANCLTICVTSAEWHEKQNIFAVYIDWQDQVKKETKFLYKVFFFIQMKNRLSKRRFDGMEEIQAELQVVVKGIAIWELQCCLQQCTKSQKGIF